MKDEYQQTRFLVQELDALPPRCGIVTACNPDGVTVSDEQNTAATERLRSHLAGAGYTFFPVTGCSPDLKHQEPGFGIVCDERSHIVQLGREWRQEAVFWVENGAVQLVPCGQGEAINLGEWKKLLVEGR